MIARASVIAALYVALGFTVQFMAYGPVQFRLPEALTLLPILFPEAILGVVVGTLIFNLFSPYWLDAVFGTSVTLIAAILTRLLRKRPPLAAAPPIVLNAFLIPVMFILLELPYAYWYAVGFVALGQAVIILGIGLPLIYALKRYPQIYGQPLRKRFEE